MAVQHYESNDGNAVMELVQKGTGKILSLQNAGGEVASFDNNGNVVSVAAFFSAGDGSVGTPGVRFTSEPTSGLYRPSAGVIATAILGVEIVAQSATATTFTAGASYAIGTGYAQSLTIM